jgi:hypothetical protein
MKLRWSLARRLTKRVWGFVYDSKAALAGYFVEWTPGHEGSSANFDLIVGTWGDDTDTPHKGPFPWSSADLRPALPSWSLTRLLGLLRTTH